MPETLTVNSTLQILLEELEFTYARSSGPGGQNVNKVNSKAVLRWPIVGSASIPDDVRQRFLARYRNRVTVSGDVVISSQRYRDAGRNQADCLDKLREMLAACAQAPRARKRTRPSRAAVARRREQKQVRSSKKQARRAPADE